MKTSTVITTLCCVALAVSFSAYLASRIQVRDEVPDSAWASEPDAVQVQFELTPLTNAPAPDPERERVRAALIAEGYTPEEIETAFKVARLMRKQSEAHINDWMARHSVTNRKEQP